LYPCQAEQGQHSRQAMMHPFVRQPNLLQ
jgi:hypothetical protein